MFAMARGAMEGLADSGARSAVAHRVLALILGGIERQARRLSAGRGPTTTAR